MVPLDGSKLAECVLPHVEIIVKASDSPEVIFIRAVEPIIIPYGREMGEVDSLKRLEALEVHEKAEAEIYLKEIASKFKKAGINTRAEVVLGKGAEALTDFANKNEIDLVIIATHGRSGVSRWVWGSTTDRLLRSIRVPILVIRAPGSTTGI